MRLGLPASCALLVTVSAMAAPAAAECKRLETPPRDFEDEYDAVVVARLDKIDRDAPFAISAQVMKPLKGSLKEGDTLTAKQGVGGAICGDYEREGGHKVLVALKKDGGAMEYDFMINDASTRFKAYERSVELHQQYLQKKSSCSTSPGPVRASAFGTAIALAAAAAFARRRRGQ